MTAIIQLLFLGWTAFAEPALFQKLTSTQPTNVCDPTTLTQCAPVSSSNGIGVDIKTTSATALPVGGVTASDAPVT